MSASSFGVLLECVYCKAKYPIIFQPVQRKNGCLTRDFCVGRVISWDQLSDRDKMGAVAELPITVPVF